MIALLELLDNVTFGNASFIPVASYQLDIVITLLEVIAGCELIRTISMLGEWGIKSLSGRR